MLRKVAAGTALVVAMLALGSVAGAQHAVTSTLPAVTIDASEPVAVSDNPLPSPPADARVDEAVTAADQIGVFPPTNASVDEAIRATDLIGVFPPTNASVSPGLSSGSAAKLGNVTNKASNKPRLFRSIFNFNLCRVRLRLL